MAKKHDPAKSVKAQIERLRKSAAKVRDLQNRLIRKQGTPSKTIESGRVGISGAGASGLAGQARDLEKVIERVAAATGRTDRAELEAALKKQLAAARETAEASRRQQAAAKEVAASKQGEEPPEATKASLESRRAELAKIADVRQRDVTPLTTIVPSSSGPRILLDYIIQPPHTLTTKDGKYCETFKWFNEAFLVYDPTLPSDAKGSENFPWFGLGGPRFRCYYPHSSDADFESCMTSGSSGRWLHAWPQKSNYVRF